MGGYYEFEVSLADIKPRIWRRFLISGDATFADLHDAIQDAFGWEDDHLWAFQEPGRQGKTIAAVPDDDFRDDDDTPDAWAVRLDAFFGGARKRCCYVYDFGDRWHHDVALKRTVQGAGDFFRKLVAGKRACPPEDCGGVFGYQRMVKFIDTGIDPAREDAEELADWVGDWRPDDFDVEDFKAVFNR